MSGNPEGTGFFERFQHHLIPIQTNYHITLSL